MRGLAIVMVLVYHIIRLNPANVTGPIFETILQVSEMGWAGVDVFFVLSGFLITTILLRTKKQPGYFQKFYARRILRIFPLYYATITLILIFIPLISPDQVDSTRSVWAWYYFYLQNWGNALNLIPTIFAIGATWSLAIEEQFYMVWPAIVRYLDSKKLGFLSLFIIALALGIRLVISWRFRKLLDFNKFFYFATITRLDSLILGALIAILFESEWWRKVLKLVAAPVFLVCLGTVGYFFWLKPHSPLVDHYPMYTYGYTFIALGSAALIVMLTTYSGKNPIRWVFRSPVLAFFGKYSYAIYLFHMIPLLILQRLFEESALDGVGYWMIFNITSLFIPIGMALVSWNLLEKRMLDLKRYFEYAR